MLRPYLQVVNFWAVILNVVQYVEYVLYGRIRLRCHGLTFQMLDPCGASWIKGFAVFLNWRLKFFSSIQQRWMKAFLCPGMPIGNRVIGWIAGSLSTLMGTLVRVKIIWLWSQTGGEWIKWASDASFCSLEFQELKEIMNRTSCTMIWSDVMFCFTQLGFSAPALSVSPSRHLRAVDLVSTLQAAVPRTASLAVLIQEAEAFSLSQAMHSVPINLPLLVVSSV